MRIKDTRKKNERQQLILDIIKNRQVSSQEELVNALAEHGIRVTQATLSRDIKKLHITKVSTADNRYVYIVPNSNDITDTLLSANRGPANPNHSVGFESLTFSGNIAVVKTRLRHRHEPHPRDSWHNSRRRHYFSGDERGRQPREST